MTTSRKRLGIAGEQYVAHYLQKRGFAVISQNYTVGGGEVDVIACKDNLLVFVEVKTRKKSLFDLTHVITPRKQQKIIAAARHYIAIHIKKIHSYSFRFDVALVECEAQSITYIPNAFSDQQREW